MNMTLPENKLYCFRSQYIWTLKPLLELVKASYLYYTISFPISALFFQSDEYI